MAINKELRKKLLKMGKADQKVRLKNISTGTLVDQRNVAELKKIIKKYGWPTITLVGKDGADAAWLIAQHADFDIKFQKKALLLLKLKAKRKEVPIHNAAYLTDRVRVNSGQPQIYGTQFYTNKNKVFGPRPIKSRRGLDKLRRKYGLPSFEMYRKLMIRLNKAR